MDEPMNDTVSRDWKGLIISLVAFVGLTGLILLVFGPTWIGVIVALVVVLFGHALRSILPSRNERKSLAGETECPHCGSMQTDSVSHVDAAGEDRAVMHCFSCERDFGEPKQLA